MILQSKNVWYNEKFQPKQLVIEDGKIKQILPYGFKSENVKDFDNDWVLPGFIDVHCHGYAGCNVNYSSLDGLVKWNKELPEEGVTSYLLTSSTSSWDSLLESYEIINDFLISEPKITEPLGIHIEGPFISKKFRGAQNEEDVQELKIDSIKQLMNKAPDKIKMVTLAFENDLDGEFTRFCTENNIIVSLGHTGISFDEVTNARNLGARSFTHTFNAMPQLHHRDPGVIGAVFYYEDMYAEVIADGVHVNFELVSILGKAKGKDKLVTVTDAVSIKGLPKGTYHFKDRIVTIDEDGCGRLPNGKLAGSSNRMDKMLNNLITRTNLPLETCINSVSKNPSKLLDLNNKGILEVGYDADIVVASPDIEIFETYCKGKQVYLNRERNNLV